MMKLSSVVMLTLVAAGQASCQGDIEAASLQLAKASEEVIVAVSDCSGVNATKCAEDVSEVVGYVSTAAEYINSAVTDCGGEGSQCAADLAELVSELSTAAADIAQAVDDCPKYLIACVKDVRTAAKALYAGGKRIAAAVADCGSARPLSQLSLGDSYKCPGSKSFIHASCEQTATFDASCSVVGDEIKARVSGQPFAWHDPHNNGTYSIMSSSADTIQLQRVTGDLKYTDKITLFLDTVGSGCTVRGCSESQVTSVADFSTNYCNVRVLYCGTKDGCNPAKTDLISAVTDVNPSLGASKDWSACLKM